MKKIYGIDSLYFFFESNEEYDNLYLDILDQMEDIKGVFRKKEIQFEKKDIHIKINDITLQYLGRREGFYFFKESQHELFRIGFKDKKDNRGLNDIRVQLQGNGIYTIGINSIIELLKRMLDGYITNFIPITRVDINCFIQYDFSFVKKDMFATRKRKYSTINEIGDANSTQTIYIGKEPFKLRLYNKSLELRKSKKFEIMNEYFLNNDFILEEPIFNIEFQLHRTHLRQYEIQTVEEVLSNVKNLFQNAMDEIRLIDTSSISEANLQNNKYQAKTNSIWEEIKNDFNIESFLQSTISLERVKRKLSIYDEKKFEFEYLGLIRKAYINNLTLDIEYLKELYLKAKDSILNPKPKKEQIKQRYVDIDIIDKEGNIKRLRQLEDGSIITPTRTISVVELSDYELFRYADKIQNVQHESQWFSDMYNVALKELKFRGLMPEVIKVEVDDESPSI
ncbi:hypothetical protein ACMC56_03965 [Campylobacterota bacterium DY0563]